MTNQEFLKANSLSQHDNIESTVDLLSWCSDRSRYVRILKAFAGFYENVEEELASFRQGFTEYGIQQEKRQKLHLLKKDLKHFEDESYSLAPTRTIQSLPEALGVMYVLEGSTLGAQVILNQLKKHGLVTDDEGGKFFSSYGKETMPMWVEFKRSLNSVPESFRTEMLSGAQKTFAALQDWLKEA